VIVIKVIEMMIYTAREYKPNECVDLGAAVGTWLGANNMILTGRDGKPVSRLLRRAMTVGLAGSGVTVLDMRLVPSMVVRAEIKKHGMGAGIYVRYSVQNGVEILLYDKNGEPAKEDAVNKINSILKRREFHRVSIEELGTILYYPNGIEDFVKMTTGQISYNKKLNIYVDAQDDPVAMLVPPLFEKYGFKYTLFNELVAGYNIPKPKEDFISNLRKGKYDYGIRFLDENIELYDGNGNMVEKFNKVVSLLEYLRGK